jgi:hypothetical protein
MSGEREPVAEGEAVHGGGHEVDRPSLRPATIGGAAFVGLMVIAFVLSYFLEIGLQKRDESQSPPANPLAVELGRQLPPEPRLQVNPGRDLMEHRRVEQEILDGYAWVDKKAGIVRIPIEQAMDVLAKRGGTAPPSFPGTKSAAGGTTEAKP